MQNDLMRSDISTLNSVTTGPEFMRQPPSQCEGCGSTNMLEASNGRNWIDYVCSDCGLARRWFVVVDEHERNAQRASRLARSTKGLVSS